MGSDPRTTGGRFNWVNDPVSNVGMVRFSCLAHGAEEDVPSTPGIVFTGYGERECSDA